VSWNMVEVAPERWTNKFDLWPHFGWYQLSVEILNQKQRKNEPPLAVPKVSYYHNEILGPASSKADSGSKEHHPREIILTATNGMTTDWRQAINSKNGWYTTYFIKKNIFEGRELCIRHVLLYFCRYALLVWPQ